MERIKTMQRRFEIGHCLGKGGFGEVYRAVVFSSGGLEHEVAIKLLHPDLLHNETARDRMRDEGRMLSRLTHPSIVTCYALTVLASRIALVTEFVPGADLSVCCKMTPALPPRALLQVIGKVSEALDLALNATAPSGQPMDLIHRDIKPGNIRVGQHGQPFLLDFGIARSDTMERNVQTAADLVVGSLLYMAPERFGPRGASGASDVFGLGCCMYEGLVGKPFYGASSLRDISRLANDAGHYRRFLEQRMVELSDSVPAALKSLIVECLQHNPDQRPTAAALGAECERLADQLGGVNLRTWARAQTWPANPGEPGVLTGQVFEEKPLPAPGETLQALLPDLNISEGPATTVEFEDLDAENTWNDEDEVSISAAPVAAPLAPAPRSLLPRRLATLLTVTALLSVFLGSGTLILALVDQWSASPSEEERELPLVPTVPVVDPPQEEPVKEERVEEKPAVKEKARSRRGGRSASSKETSVNEEEVDVGTVQEDIKPPPVRATFGPVQVASSGDAAVELRGKGKIYPLPAKVPPGTYQIWADFGDGLSRSSSIVVNPGDQASVNCLITRKSCRYTIQ